MDLCHEDRANARVITIMEPRIDAAGAIEFKDRLRDIAADGPGRVILDLAAVDFLDSSGLGAVVAAMKLLAPDRTLELAALTPNVEKVFRLTRMDQVFAIHADVAAATGTLQDAS